MHDVSLVRDKLIYLDNNATTACIPEVRDAVCACMAEQWGNASSQHYIGRQAHRLLENAREKTATALGCRKSELFFNSGATEGNNWIFWSILKGNPERRRIVVSAIEHKSVLLSAKALAEHGFEVIELPVDLNGMVDTTQAESLITPDTALVSCQYANNETGVIQPVERLCAIAHEKGCMFHCDAVQGFGKAPLDLALLDADAATFSAHKIHGPQGVGALFLKKSGRTWPFAFPVMGGGQEHDVRPGTYNLPGIVGFGVAAEAVHHNLKQRVEHMAELQKFLERELHNSIPGCVIHGEGVPRIPNTTNVGFPNIPADILMANLPLFCVSNGSACNSGSMSPSYVLQAMHVPDEIAECSIRLSTSFMSTIDDISSFIHKLHSFIESWN